MTHHVSRITFHASRFTHHVSRFTHHAPLLVLVALAVGLRLMVWGWHEQYPLGGDEREYFEQALTLLRERNYVELKLMRPPLYTVFLVACIYLFDSLIQRLRLIQELVSTLTVVPAYLLTRQLFGSRRVALVGALLVAANYTLAANATELLTETLFLFGLTTLFWLLLKARSSPPSLLLAALAGLTLGALALLRSVALPLLPLGALWLLGRPPTTDYRPPTAEGERGRGGEGERGKGPEGRNRPSSILHPLSSIFGSRFSVLGSRFSVLCSLFFVLCSFMVIAPWTLRNYAVYGAPILVDTTGPENLWLDNDPAGREEVKQQLYALGEDRAARQRIALERGGAAITADPRRFLAKAWGEARKFFALEYFDAMREDRAIWIPPAEVWLRLLLGDGLWLVLLLGGAAGLWLASPTTDHRPPTTEDRGLKIEDSNVGAPEKLSSILYPLSSDQKPAILHPPSSILSDPRWLFVPWALYTLLTAMIFHVELRYRLPLYPALLPYAAWALTYGARRAARTGARRRARQLAAALTCLLLAGLTLAHRPYIGEAWMLAGKHARLWQAERALERGDAPGARTAALAALGWDPESALAQVALARAALAQGDAAAARQALDAAREVLPDHPYVRLLRGAVLRQQGDADGARAELAHERDSREDLQRWAWRTFAPAQPQAPVVEVGGGLDLGYVRGFWFAEPEGFRWSTGEAEVRLAALPDQAARLDLRLAAGRPAGAAAPRVTLLLDGHEIGQVAPSPSWQTYRLPLAPELASRLAGPLVLTIRSDTFRPRDFDRSSPDNRLLGVMVGRVELVPASAP